MTPTEQPITHSVLLVDNDGTVREIMTGDPPPQAIEVVAAAHVTEAPKQITTETFDVLTTDLHMPNPGDGFTV